MSAELLNAIFSLAGIVISAGVTAIATNKVVEHRLAHLEKKVDKHNQVLERTYRLEEQMNSVKHRVKDLEDAK